MPKISTYHKARFDNITTVNLATAATGDSVKYEPGGLLLIRNANATLTRTVTLPIYVDPRRETITRQFTIPAASFAVIALRPQGTDFEGFIPLTYSAAADLTLSLIKWEREE